MASRKLKSSPARVRSHAGNRRPKLVSPQFGPRSGGPNNVQRTEIIRQCLGVPPGNIVLLEAAAGYGKTAVFAQWYTALRAQQSAVVWLTLRESERTWPALGRTLAAAMDFAGFALPRDLAQFMDSSNPDSSDRDGIRRFTDRLAESIHRFRRPVTLLLDDCECAASPAFEHFLGELFEQLPGNLIVGVASRQLLQFSVSRWLLQGRLHRLEKRDLLFSKAETHEFFGASLSPAELNRLHTLTEGWPAAVRFAQICLEEWRRRQVSLETLPVYSRLVGDFCMSEVLKGVDDESAALLILASAFETIEPDLCDAVSQRSDSAMRIAAIASRETFLDHTDTAANTWRIPKMLRQTLLNRALAQSLTPLATIHLRAAEHYEARGTILEAVRHYVAAGNASRAAMAFERVSPMSYAARQGDERGSAILDLIPPHCLAQYPRLALCRAYLDYKKGFLNEARYLLERVAERTNDFAVDREGGDDAQFHVEWLICALEMEIYSISKVTSDYLQSVEARIAQISRADPRLADFAHCMGGIVCAIRGELDAARSHFIQCEKLSAQAPQPWLELWLKYHRGSLALAHGQMMEAKFHLQAGLKQWRREFFAYKSFSAAATVLLAEIDYENDALDEAQTKIDSAIYIVENTEGWYEHYSAVYELALMMRLHSRHPTEAEALLDRAVSIKRVNHVLSDFLPVLRLRLALLRRMDPDANALETVDRLHERWSRPESHEDFSWRAWDLAGICLCHCALQVGDLQRASEVLDRLERDVRRQRRSRTLLKVLALRSALHHRQGQLKLATTQMLQALELGLTQGYRRAFLDEGIAIRPVLEMVAHHPLAPVPARCATFAAKLIDAIDARTREYAPASIKLLSDRETDVILELTQGRSNKAIGRKLTLCESTVKFHIKNIFRKLGVRRRDAAVTEAKRRGLVH